MEDDADDAYAVEVKLIIGLSAICTTMSGEKEEQPAALKRFYFDSITGDKCISGKYTSSVLTPSGLSSK